MIKPVINNVISNIINDLMVSSSYVPTTNTDLIQWLFTDAGFGILDGQPVVKSKSLGEFREPVPPNCCLFDGVGSYINCGARSDLDFELGFSVSFWIKTTQTNTTGILSRGAFNIDGWEILAASTGIIVRTYQAGAYTTQGFSTAYNDGDLHNVCIIIGATTTRFFMDGVLISDVSSTLSAPVTSSRDLCIGTRSASRAALMAGTLKDVCIYDSEITSADATQIYETPANPPTTGLAAWYQLECGSGSTEYCAVTGQAATVEGATLSTFRATDPDIKATVANESGYTDSDGVIIPRLLGAETDVTGGDLQYVGPVSPPAKLVDSACLAVNLGTEYLQFDSIPTGAVIDSYQYTGTDPNPQIDTINNKITLTADSQIFNIVINDSGGSLWAHLSCAEKAGEICYDHSGNGNDATLTGFTLSSAWAETQDKYHDHIWRGFSLYEHATDEPLYVSYDLSGDPLLITPPTGYTKTDDYAAGNYFPPAETKIKQYSSAKMIQAGDDFWFTAADIPNAISYADVVAQMDAGRVMADISIPAEKKNILTFDQEQTGSDLINAENYLNQ